MTVHQLAEFAALIASHNRPMIEGPQDIDETALNGCWATIRNRLVDLLRRLEVRTSTGTSEAISPDERAAEWGELTPLLEEAFATEMLVRVWGALLAARQTRHAHSEGGEIARSLLVLLLKVRRRGLQLLVDGSLNEEVVPQIAAVDRMRRKLERWTDVLLGEMVLRDNVGDYACDVRRAREFGVDYFQNQTHVQYHCTWHLLKAGTRLSFESQVTDKHAPSTAADDLRRAILRCLPVDAFETDGPSLSLRALRIQRQTQAGDRRPAVGTGAQFLRSPFPLGLESSTPADGISFSKLRRGGK